ncbi:MAG: hypothetical protein A4E52_01822 [Pelotomaculum sp. PtaB.Bin013]|nr:MAG: hypothetical protein A4E52_01822 [Pelotomaculum sp. PtaB.Bin013]
MEPKRFKKRYQIYNIDTDERRSHETYGDVPIEAVLGEAQFNSDTNLNPETEGLMQIISWGQPRRYADHENKFNLFTNASLEAVKNWVIKHFRVTDDWYTAKLKEIRPLSDGKGYYVYFIEPYLD